MELSERCKERMTIYNICKKFELDHSPNVLLLVDPGCAPHRWVLRMGYISFDGRGKFSKEASRTVIFGRKDLERQVKEVLEGMYKEVFG